MVFRDIEFALRPGGFALVKGANGSGKSSLLRVLAGLIEPASGRMEWRDFSVGEAVIAERPPLHYIGHLDAVKPPLTIREMLNYWAALRGVGIPSDMDGFGLGKLADTPIRRLSAGQKRRLSLMRLLIDDAPLWLLDEPTTALDEEGQDLLRAHIVRHRVMGGIVIAATHDDFGMSDAQIIAMGGAHEKFR